MLDEVALAHEHGIHVQARCHMLDEVLGQHGGLDLPGAPHSGVRRPVALAEVQVKVELGEGICLCTCTFPSQNASLIGLQLSTRLWLTSAIIQRFEEVCGAQH